MSRLPFFFIFTGIIGFVTFQAVSLSSLSGWLGEPLREQSGWFHIHLFVLGWGTMLAMGAVYQLINVILQKDFYSAKLGYIHYALFTPGLIGLLYGFIEGRVYWLAGSACLALAGILVFAWNMAATLIRAKKWDAITISAACAVFYLALTGLSGLTMGLNFAIGKWPELHERLFGAHIWMGTIGWFGLLITGFSYKLLPMFYLSHDYPTKPQAGVLILWNASVLTGALSFLLGGSIWFKWAAILLLTLAVLLYNYHLLQIKRKRHKRNPGSGIKWTVYGSQAFGCLLVVLLVYAAIFPDRMLNAREVLAAGWIYLVGWVSFTILGYASKIVPFLWWTHKYGKHAGKPGTPLMANLLNDRKANAGLAAIAACCLVLLVGIASGSQTTIEAAGTALSVCSIAYIALIGLVFTR